MGYQLESPLDVERIRKDFPILERKLAGGRSLVYLDSANTSQKPQQVIDALSDHYAQHNANVARAVHQLGEEATAAYEAAREKVARLIHAEARDVVFTKNASEAINVVANSLASGLAEDPGYRLGPGDEIVITEMDHHSNIVPWQLAAQRTGAKLRWFGLTDEGRLDISNLEELINPSTTIVSLVHQSNILGTVNSLSPIVERAHQVGALVMIDAAQSVPHKPIDVNDLGVDLLACTGHKMCGPTGVGVLWGKREVLEALPPFLGGGEMIETVAMEGSTYAPPPHKFEAGTPPIAQAIGLGAAVDYLTAIGMANIEKHEEAITAYALEQLQQVEGVRIIGPKVSIARGGTVSFTLEGVHPHDVGQVLDEEGIAVRVGHHCARPVCLRYGIPATTRASFYVYTTKAEIDTLVLSLDRVRTLFQ